MTDYAISFALLKSLQSHISDNWGSDLYDFDGNQTRAGYCPTELIPTLSYTDMDGASRIFGPCNISIGRTQDDVLGLANNIAVPSAYIDISSNDFENIEAWRDSLFRAQDGGKQIGPGSEYPILIGGANTFYRRIVVKMTTFFLDSKQNDEEVARLTSAAKSLLEALCTSFTSLPYSYAWKMYEAPNVIISDPFGEKPWQAVVTMSHNRRRGGGPDNYITDIKLYLEVATFKEA